MTVWLERVKAIYSSSSHAASTRHLAPTKFDAKIDVDSISCERTSLFSALASKICRQLFMGNVSIKQLQTKQEHLTVPHNQSNANLFCQHHTHCTAQRLTISVLTALTCRETIVFGRILLLQFCFSSRIIETSGSFIYTQTCLYV